MEFFTASGMMLGAMLVALIFGVAILIFILWTLVDMLKARNDSTWKILWLLVIVLIPFIGSILYYFIGRAQKSKNINGRR